MKSHRFHGCSYCQTFPATTTLFAEGDIPKRKCAHCGSLQVFRLLGEWVNLDD